MAPEIADHRADREVDAAGRDHERHAERDEHQRRAEARGCRSGSRRGGRPACAIVKNAVSRRRDRTSRSAAIDEQRARTGGAWRGSCGAPRRRSCARACRRSRRRRSRAPRRACRSRSTATLWLRRSTSSSSAEMKSTDMPSSQSETTRRWISVLAPTSMPRVGSSRISSFGCGEQPAGEQHLLLVAAAQGAHRLLGARGPDVERADPVLGELVLALAWNRPRPAASRLQREDDVLPDGQVLDEALASAGSRGRTRCRARSRPAGCGS